MDTKGGGGMNSIYLSVTNRWSKKTKIRRIIMKTRKLRLTIKNNKITLDYGERYPDGISISGEFKAKNLEVEYCGIASWRSNKVLRLIIMEYNDGKLMAWRESKDDYNVRKAFCEFGGFSLSQEVDDTDEFGEDGIIASVVDENGDIICACNNIYYFFESGLCTVKDVNELITKFNNIKEKGGYGVKYVEIGPDDYAALTEYFKSKAFVMDIIGHHHESRLTGKMRKFDPVSYVIPDDVKDSLGWVDPDELYNQEATWFSSREGWVSSKALNYFYRMYYIVKAYEKRKTWIHQKYPNVYIPDKIVNVVDAYMTGMYHEKIDTDKAIKNYLLLDADFAD